MAIKQGWIDLFKWTLSSLNFRIDSSIYHISANSGSLAIMKYIYENDKDPELDSWICSNAVAHGHLHLHLHIIKWVRKIDNSICSELTHHNAVRGSHTNIIEWLNKNKCSCRID